MARRVTTAKVLGAALLLGLGASATAQEIEPRTYSNIPIGVNFAVAGYSHMEGGVAADPSLPIENARLATEVLLLGYAHAIALGGQSGKIDFGVPYVWLDGSARLAGEPRSRRVAGFGDPTVRISFNLLGAPALRLPEFASYRQGLIVGMSLQAGLPLGQYDETRLVNLGTNRWWLRPELGASKAVGRWTFEAAASATVYGDNDAFRGDLTREQDPVYSVQGGVICSLNRGVWLALSANYYTGGRTTVDGVKANDLQQNSRVRFTAAWPLSRQDSLKFFAGTGVSTRTGTDFDSISLAWQRRWGGGL